MTFRVKQMVKKFSTVFTLDFVPPPPESGKITETPSINVIYSCWRIRRDGTHNYEKCSTFVIWIFKKIAREMWTWKINRIAKHVRTHCLCRKKVGRYSFSERRRSFHGGSEVNLCWWGTFFFPNPRATTSYSWKGEGWNSGEIAFKGRRLRISEKQTIRFWLVFYFV